MLCRAWMPQWLPFSTTRRCSEWLLLIAWRGLLVSRFPPARSRLRPFAAFVAAALTGATALATLKGVSAL